MNRERAREIVRALRRRDTPLAAEAARCIEWLLKQVPQEAAAPAGGKLHPLHERLILIFQSRINKPVRDAREMTAWKRIAALVTEEDVALLEAFYRLPQSPPEQSDETWCRKRGILHLLHQYVAQVELAETYRVRHPGKFRARAQVAQPAIPEPAGWQERAPGALAERSWLYVLEHYPEIARELAGGVE